MSMNDGELHLLPFMDNNDFNNSSSESEDDESVEVVSNVDEEENQIVDMTKYLTFSSDDESEIDDNVNDITHNDTGLDSDSDIPDDDVIENHASNECTTNSTSSSLIVAANVSDSNTNINKTSKRKRRQWSIAEKLNAIKAFKSNGSKRRTAIEHGCTTAQLRKWVKCENELSDIIKRKKG